MLYALCSTPVPAKNVWDLAISPSDRLKIKLTFLQVKIITDILFIYRISKNKTL